MPREAGRRRPRRRPTLGFPQEQLAGEEPRSSAAAGEGRPLGPASATLREDGAAEWLCRRRNWSGRGRGMEGWVRDGNEG
jgi:hypothetical protein